MIDHFPLGTLCYKLYHLDDYDRCLSREDGVYCVGTFELTPREYPHALYTRMEKYTNSFLKFNRTLIHRGWCVSARCAGGGATGGAGGGAERLFASCMSRRTARRALSARLAAAHCTTHAERRELATRAPDSLETLYLYAIYAILLLNILGTAYDVMYTDNSEKNKYLMAWSVRSNWNKLTETSSSSPIHAYKTIMHWHMMYAHSALLHFAVYVYNPYFLEMLYKGVIGHMIRNGTAAVQSFILISCFHTAYNFKETVDRNGASWRLVLKWSLKRVVRFLPAYLVVLGYAATWWARAGGGPLWPQTVLKESNTCRQKFWYQLLFINNVVDNSEFCILQSWFLAADMQLSIVTLLLVVTIQKFRLRATYFLGALFAAACAVNVVLAYVNGWTAMIEIVVPEVLRVGLSKSSAFANVHISPWGNLPACILGLLAAHILYDMKKMVKHNGDAKESRNGGLSPKNVPLRDEGESSTSRDVTSNTEELGVRNMFYQSGLNYLDVVCAVAVLAWVMTGASVDWAALDSRLTSALYVGVERVVFSAVPAVCVSMVIVQRGVVNEALSWRGWQALGRLSYCLMLVNWLVNVTVVGGRPYPISTSYFYFSMDFLTTFFYTYLIALPLCLMVELPMRRLQDMLM